MSFPLVAGGNIPPARFVTLSGNNNTVVVSASGDACFGISANYTHNVPGTIGGVAIDDGYAAISGMGITVYDQSDSERGQPIFVELGGTVSIGNFLKPGAANDGKAIATTADGDFYGARALESGVSGQLIKVQVITGYRGA